MSLWFQWDCSPVTVHRLLIPPTVPCAACIGVLAHQRGTLACWFPRKGMGGFCIMLFQRDFLIYVHILEMTPLQPCLVAYKVPSVHITPDSLLPKPIHHFCTWLLVTLSLLYHSYFKALLIRLDSLLAKVFFPAWSHGSCPFQAIVDLQWGSHGHRSQDLVSYTSCTNSCWPAGSIYSSSSPSISLAGSKGSPPGPPCPWSLPPWAMRSRLMCFRSPSAVSSVLTWKSRREVVWGLEKIWQPLYNEQGHSSSWGTPIASCCYFSVLGII